MIKLALSAFIFFGFSHSNLEPTIDVTLDAKISYEEFYIPLQVVVYSNRDVYRFGYISEILEKIKNMKLNSL